MAKLAEYLDRLGWSAERLGREVNREAGPNTVSRKAPYAWIKGARPRGVVPEIVAAILTAKLGETVTVPMLWPRSECTVELSAPSGPYEPWTQGEPWTAATDVFRISPDSPGTLPGLPSHALTGPVLDWLTFEAPEIHGRDLGRQQVTPEMMYVLAERVAQLRRLDDAQGGPLVLDWVTDDLRRAATLAREGSYDAETGRLLHQILAELAQLAGWLASDQDLTGLGQRYLLTGLRAAHTAGDAALGANIVSCLSYQAAWAGEHGGALSLIRAARKGADRPQVGLVHALLATRQARVHAQLAEESACARALDEAAAAYAGGSPSNEPAWAYWVTPAVLAADAGRAWFELGRSDKAETHLVRGLELFGEEQPRNRMLHNASLAEARLDLGDLDGAADAAGRAFDLGERLISGRARARLRTVQARFEKVDSRKAQEVVDRAHHVLRSS